MEPDELEQYNPENDRHWREWDVLIAIVRYQGVNTNPHQAAKQAVELTDALITIQKARIKK